MLFEKHGKVTECDVLGSYGFVHIETESEAEEAISNLDKTIVQGQAINVEKSKGGGGSSRVGVPSRGGFRMGGGGAFPGSYASGDFGSKAARRAGCTKLHIANLPDSVQSNELRELFERYGYVAECDVVEDRKIAFVHIEDSASDAAIQGLNGHQFKGMSLKVQISKNQMKAAAPGGSSSAHQHYSSQYSTSMYSSPNANSSIPTIQGRGRGVTGLPVRTDRVPMPMQPYPTHDPMARGGYPPIHDPTKYAMSYGPPAVAVANGQEAYTEHNLPPPAKDRMELLDLLERRRRLEALDPYERRLIACTDVYNLPMPPPEFLRRLRDRALVKVRLPLPPTASPVSRTTIHSAPPTAPIGVAAATYAGGKISAPPVAYTSMYAPHRNGSGY